MSIAIPHFMVALPEMFVLGMACFALLAHLYLGRRFVNLAYSLVQLTLFVAAIMTIMRFSEPSTVSFSGLFISDTLASLLKLFIYLTVFGAFFYSKLYVQMRNIPRGEYYILGLFATLGMMVMVSAHSLLTLYLGLELLSLPLYAMVALCRDSVLATEAAMKYFVMGAIASSMLLYGMSMLYGATGSLDIAQIAKIIAAMPANKTMLLTFGLVFIVAGLAFKLAAAPFHMWAPDVYTGAPSAVTLFLATAPKVAALGMVMRLLVFAMPGLLLQWQQLLIVLAVFSMGVGNLFAIAQSNLKRMLAYSAIAHIGFMFLGLIAGNNAGYTASLFYILIYSITSLGGFGLIVLLSKAGFEAENIADLQGLNKRNPLLAFLLLVIMLSMAGVPPTVGFFAKLFVIKALVDVHMIWLAVLAMAIAVLGAFYYIRVIKTMYFEDPSDSSPITIPRNHQIAFSINSLALLALGCFPIVILHLCQLAFAS